MGLIPKNLYEGKIQAFCAKLDVFWDQFWAFLGLSHYFMKVQKKHAKIEEHRDTANSCCQKGTVPETAEIHPAMGRFDFFDLVLAAQVPTGPDHTTVGSGPHTPHPKDYPGLGDPNTLK